MGLTRSWPVDQSTSLMIGLCQVFSYSGEKLTHVMEGEKSGLLEALQKKEVMSLSFMVVLLLLSYPISK